MSAQKRPQPSAAEIEEPVGAQHRAHEPIPHTVRDGQLMAFLGLKHTAYCLRKARGEFRFLELKPQLSNSNTLYSGHLVSQWLRGEERVTRFYQAGVKKQLAPSKRRPGRPRKGNTETA